MAETVSARYQVVVVDACHDGGIRVYLFLAETVSSRYQVVIIDACYDRDIKGIPFFGGNGF